MWTRFWDMRSGGGQKLDWALIYIELPEDEAVKYFAQRFKRDPNNITCTCCGPDYSIDEQTSLLTATGYHRNCDHDGDNYIEQKSHASHNAHRTYFTLEEYEAKSNVLIIRKEDI